jgi:uncharacterized 2Fe-2S/4Fe-4S cluster protein (DUF4445 family)
VRGCSEKVFLHLELPDEAQPVSDQARLEQALQDLGYAPVVFSLQALRQLYPICRSDAGITVTLVCRETDWVAAAVETADQRAAHYGLAVDYGSTTVVMQLVDMTSGAVIDQVSQVNGQTAYGTDILTRITYSLEDPAHMEQLQQATAETFNRLLLQLQEQTGVDAGKCPAMILSGNTTMIHFLLKLNAWSVFAAPYAPVTMEPGWFWGRELGMRFDGMVYIIPGASNYIGGDIISGLLKLDLHRREKTSLFFDIGTNGELVIGNREWILAGAGAAGPALEGYISRFGMRAAPGAVDTVRITGEELQFTTIGGQKPVGICGSGIIDLLAQMLLSGWIRVSGELDPKASPRIRYLEEEKQYAAVYALEHESADGKALFFTQTDIRQYLDTKAAAYTMIECLLETAGCQPEELDRCYLSGAFTAHSDLESAITIGMFPDLPRQRYTCIANTSLEGARILLLNRERLPEVRTLARSVYCVQFASIPDFLVRMQAAKFIPHTDMRRYPTVLRRLEACSPDI